MKYLDCLKCQTVHIFTFIMFKADPFLIMRMLQSGYKFCQQVKLLCFAELCLNIRISTRKQNIDGEFLINNVIYI